MALLEFISADVDWFNYLILPLMIFAARVVDVTLGTLRIIFVSRSMRLLAPAIGFVEALIWLLAVGQIFQHLTNPVLYIAYAAGFAAGNYMGIYLEGKLAMGLQVVRTITAEDATELIEYLKENDFGVTSISASGVSGQVRLILSVIKRKDLPRLIQVIREKMPKAFISVEDVRSVNEGFFPQKNLGLFSRLPLKRK